MRVFVSIFLCLSVLCASLMASAQANEAGDAPITLTLSEHISNPTANLTDPSTAFKVKAFDEEPAPNLYAEAYISQDSRLKYGDGSNETYHEVQGFVSYGTSIGLWAFAYSSYAPKSYNSYQEAYVGPYVRAGEWLEVGLGYGFESFPGEEMGDRVYGGRLGGYADIYLGKATISLSFEDGKSGWYFEHRAGYQITEQIYIGGEWYQHLGAGPSLTLSHQVSDRLQVRVTTSYLRGRGDDIQPTETLKFYFELIFGG